MKYRKTDLSELTAKHQVCRLADCKVVQAKLSAGKTFTISPYQVKAIPAVQINIH